MSYLLDPDPNLSIKYRNCGAHLGIHLFCHAKLVCDRKSSLFACRLRASEAPTSRTRQPHNAAPRPGQSHARRNEGRPRWPGSPHVWPTPSSRGRRPRPVPRSRRHPGGRTSRRIRARGWIGDPPVRTCTTDPGAEGGTNRRPGARRRMSPLPCPLARAGALGPPAWCGHPIRTNARAGRHTR